MSGPAQPLPVDDAGLPEEVREIVAKARSSWLKNSEVFQILQHATSGLLPLSTSPPELPPGGTLFLIDRSSCRTFRKDQHQWRKKPDNKTVRETHEKLKVGTTERLNCYYAHADQQDQLQRRCYWLLEQQYEYAVLVHYLNAPSTRTQRSVGGGLPAPDAAGAGDAPAPQRPQRANRGQNSRYAHLGFDQGSGSLGADGTPRASTTTGSDLDYEPAASGGYDVDDDAPNGGIPGGARHAPGSVAWLAAQHRPASPPGTASRLPRFPSDVSFGLGLMPEPSGAAGASLAAGARRDAGSVQGSLPPSLAEQWAEHSRRGGAAPPLEELVGHAGGLLRAQRLHSSQQQQGQGVPGAFSPRGEAPQVAWPAPGATFDDLLSQHYAAALQRAQRADPDWEGEEGEGGARAGAAQPSAGLLMISRGLAGQGTGSFTSPPRGLHPQVSFTASEADLARSLFPQLSLGLEGVEGSGASVTGPGGGGVGVQPSTGSFTAANGGGLDGFLASPQRLHSRRTSSGVARLMDTWHAAAGFEHPLREHLDVALGAGSGDELAGVEARRGAPGSPASRHTAAAGIAFLGGVGAGGGGGFVSSPKPFSGAAGAATPEAIAASAHTLEPSPATGAAATPAPSPTPPLFVGGVEAGARPLADRGEARRGEGAAADARRRLQPTALPPLDPGARAAAAAAATHDLRAAKLEPVRTARRLDGAAAAAAAADRAGEEEEGVAMIEAENPLFRFKSFVGPRRAGAPMLACTWPSAAGEAAGEAAASPREGGRRGAGAGDSPPPRAPVEEEMRSLLKNMSIDEVDAVAALSARGSLDRSGLWFGAGLGLHPAGSTITEESSGAAEGAARSASFEASVSGSEAAEPALRFAIEDFMPETALVLGGDKMFVTGSVRSAAGLWERHVHLKFGEEEVPAVVLNATVLKCNVPRAPTPGRVRLCVTLGDGVPVSNTVAFTYRHVEAWNGAPAPPAPAAGADVHA
ncbi:hypothetical protein ACKKBF_B36315 [Auxenochlorella protothecoides x Auxenochlorella symbiontica]